jgi:hypothetical protein
MDDMGFLFDSDAVNAATVAILQWFRTTSVYLINMDGIPPWETMMSNKSLDSDALDTLFRSACSHSYWSDKPVTDEQLHKLYKLMKWGPTSGNCTPARLAFVCSQQAKERPKSPLMLAT